MWLRKEVSLKFGWGIREASRKSCHLIKASKNNTTQGFFGGGWQRGREVMEGDGNALEAEEPVPGKPVKDPGS